MSKSVFISAEDIKALVRQWNNKESRLILHEVIAKSGDTLCQVSQLRKEGLVLSWVNKDALNADIPKEYTELVSGPLPF